MKPTFTPSHFQELNQTAFSRIAKGRAITVNPTGLIATGDTGYRSIIATKGASEGTFYYQAIVMNPSQQNLNIPSNPIPPTAPFLQPLVPSTENLRFQLLDYWSQGFSAHTRIGFATLDSNLELPVGAEPNSYSYKDSDGSVFHSSFGRAYGRPYSVNDVISCLIHLEPQKPKIKGVAVESFVISEGSFIKFFVNGEDQGVAFMDVLEGTYFPAVALYQYARIEINLAGKMIYPSILKEYNAKPFA